jgi:hypothetical protein
MLHDLGAAVVKVEGPTGDPAFRFGVTHEGLGAMRSTSTGGSAPSGWTSVTGRSPPHRPIAPRS